MYNNFKELLDLCQPGGMDLCDAIIANEVLYSECSNQAVLENTRGRLELMRTTAKRYVNTPSPLGNNMISGLAKQAYQGREDSICGNLIGTAMAYALSCSETNATMGKICAAPTAGACGVLPAVLVAMEEDGQVEEDLVVKSMVVAGGLGAIVMQNATVSGAEGGCQAECGVAAAMAAGAAVYMKGGTAHQVMTAACFALINVLGLVCDPIAGLVQIPCAQRNASQAVNALISADMALSGQVFPIPLDEVVEAMFKVGKALPESLLETANGGLATTPTGQELAKAFYMTQDM